MHTSVSAFVSLCAFVFVSYLYTCVYVHAYIHVDIQVYMFAHMHIRLSTRVEATTPQVVTWGNAAYGGDSGTVQSALRAASGQPC